MLDLCKINGQDSEDNVQDIPRLQLHSSASNVQDNSACEAISKVPFVIPEVVLRKCQTTYILPFIYFVIFAAFVTNADKATLST